MVCEEVQGQDRTVESREAEKDGKGGMIPVSPAFGRSYLPCYDRRQRYREEFAVGFGLRKPSCPHGYHLPT